MFEDLKKRRHDRIDKEKNTYVTCHTFYRWVKRATLGFVILALGFVANSYIDRNRAADAREALVKSGTAIAVNDCNRDFRLYQTIRGTFQRSLVVVKQQHDAGLTTDDQYARAVAFYEQQLLQFTLPDCRKTQALLTDDPQQAEQRGPRPLYHGSPEENIIVFDPKPNGG